MGEKRTLIETFLPVEEISAESKIEKKGRAPTFELHYWWTRKPLVAARATVLGALLPEDFDVIEFKRLLGLGDKKKRAHKYDLSKSQLESLKKKYKEVWGNDKPSILDPFAGGGSIPFEAVRMGCTAFSNDYNPVAHLIQNATIDYPAKYSEKLYEDVELALNWVFDKAQAELNEFYPKHNGKDVSAYIHAWMVSCPDCGFKNPLVGKWWLSDTKEKKIYLKPIIDTEKRLKMEICYGTDVPERTVIGGKGKCLDCGKTIPNDHIKNEILENDEEMLLAVVLLAKKGKEYDLPNENDLKAFQKSKEILDKNWDLFLKEDLIPIEKMPEGDIRSTKYLKYWYKFLNPRQRLLFITLIKLIREYIDTHDFKGNKDYKIAIATYISFILGKHIDYNCRSIGWIQKREIVAHALTARGISMMWDHAEVNPFVKASGTLISVNNRILRSLNYSIEKLKNLDDKKIIIENKSILDSEFKTQIIVTDPPYFDDVQYPELSEFFYVFEKRALQNLIDLPKETPKSQDLSVGGNRSEELFQHLFTLSCQKMNSMLTDDGILIMYFAHSSVKAWDFVLTALRNAKLRITATWPIHTESPDNPLARGKASIMSSIVIVARKRQTEKSGFIEEIKEDLADDLKEKFNELWNHGLRGADITVAAMGATLNQLTQYSEIKSISGDFNVTDILELAEIYVVQYTLDKFIKNSESLDGATRFYVYCRLSELDAMPFDTANLISKSLNIDLSTLDSSGLVLSIKKGKTKGVKLLKFNERENINDRTLIDCVHLSMRAYESGGKREFESTLNNIQYSSLDIFNVLSAFQHLESGDSEKQIALQILGKSADLIPKKGQTTFD